MFVDQVKIYVKAETEATVWLLSAAKNMCQKEALPEVTAEKAETSFSKLTKVSAR